ncbi:MAG: ankyrin repeat domain-containing protein [Anaerolineae bacterium]|nr:ankyrin repeat domain-containing protein [Anaerolineae bacterium]
MAELTLEDIKTFVQVAHFDLAKVQELLEADPRLLNVINPDFDESALGAASHVGRRDIAQYLLDKGAPLTIYTAAMLGMKDQVRKFLRDDPAQAQVKGAHGFTNLFHAALSGDVEIAQMLHDAGSTEGLGSALHAAIWQGHEPMLKWLLEQGADVQTPNYQGKTPLDAATEQQNTAMVTLLKAHGAN